MTIAWAAGLFEGEGCLALDKRGLGLIRVILASTDRDVVERFRTAIGCGYIWERDYKKYKNQWVWEAHGDEAVQAINLILPWLGARRTEKAKELLESRAALIAEATRERTCPRCGSKFRAEFNSGWKLRKYCSPDCKPPWVTTRETAMERVRDLSWA